jgi:hypothetical protein
VDRCPHFGSRPVYSAFSACFTGSGLHYVPTFRVKPIASSVLSTSVFVSLAGLMAFALGAALAGEDLFGLCAGYLADEGLERGEDGRGAHEATVAPLARSGFWGVSCPGVIWHLQSSLSRRVGRLWRLAP